MATITSSVSQVYEGSATSSVKIVGYNAKTNYVARYSFVSPAIGASGVSWSIPHNYVGGGTAPALRWYITTSSTSHINAGASTNAYHGTVTKTDAGGGDYTFSGSADIVLPPSKTYYLWIFPATTTYGFYNLTHSQTATITTSGASYSEISVADSVTLGAEQTISVTRYSTSLTHTITYACGSASGTICTKSTATSIKWTPPISLASQNTTGRTVAITLTIETFSGSASIGIRTKTIVASIPESVKPSCEIYVSDDTDNAEIYGGYIVGISKLNVKITPTLAYGSPIATYRASANGETYTVASFTTGAVKDLNPFTVSATVTDKRDRSGSASTTLTILDYAAPVVSLLKVNRCDADGTENDQGEYVKVTFSGSVTPLNNKNAKSCKLEYKKSSAMTYTVVDLRDFERSYTVTNGTYIFAADTGSSYDVRLTITDAFYATAKATSASTAAVIMHWKANGRGIGLGKVSEKDDTLDLGWDVEMNGHQLLNNGNQYFPEMALGVEYLTPERCNGKPVYAKLVDFGAFPNTANKNVRYANNFEATVVSLHGQISDGVPFTTGYNQDRTTPGTFWVDATHWNIRILTESDMSAVTATVLVKYIRGTQI